MLRGADSPGLASVHTRLSPATWPILPVCASKQCPYGTFAVSAVIIPRGCASQLPKVPQAKRFIDLVSQEQREEPLAQVILRPYDPSNVNDDVSNAENINSQFWRSGALTWETRKLNLNMSSPSPVEICLNPFRGEIHAQSPRSHVAECNVNSPLKDVKPEVLRMQGQR